MAEVYWSPVPAETFSDRYFVSSDGRIWSVIRQILLRMTTRNGYHSVCLYKEDVKKSFHVHRLVALAFLPRMSSDLVVNHKNGNMTDNRVENLEWISQRENVSHALETGLKVPKGKRVAKYSLTGDKLAVYDTTVQAALDSGQDARQIAKVLKGIRESVGGFVWKYEDEGNDHVEFTGFGVEVPGYPNYYIRADGEIYSIRSKKYLKPKLHHSGYLAIGLCNNGDKKDFYVHRLVASVFLMPVQGKDKVNHKNMNKLDNNVENLEWVTDEENLVHAIINKNFVHRKAVSQHDIAGTLIRTYASVKEANEITKIDNSSIVKCCKGKVSHAGGFLWRYIQV